MCIEHYYVFEYPEGSDTIIAEQFVRKVDKSCHLSTKGRFEVKDRTFDHKKRTTSCTAVYEHASDLLIVTKLFERAQTLEGIPPADLIHERKISDSCEEEICDTLDMLKQAIA